jgi:hypothetical protein
VGHSDCGNVQLGAQVQRQAGSSRMITGGGIEQQHVRTIGQGTYGLLHQRAEPQSHQSGHIRSARGTADHVLFEHPANTHDHCGRPGWIMISAGTDQAARKAHPAAADDRTGGIEGQ